MTESLRAATHFLVKPLGYVDRVIYDYTPLKNYQKITTIVNTALALAIHKAVSLITLRYEIKIMPPVAAMATLVLYYLFTLTNRGRTQLHNERLYAYSGHDTMGYSIDSGKASSTIYTFKDIVDMLAFNNFFLLCTMSDLSWEAVLAAAEDLKEVMETPISKTFNEQDPNGASLLWTMIHSKVHARYEIAKGLLEHGTDANIGLKIEASSFQDIQVFMFILKLVQGNKLNDSSIATIKTAWEELAEDTKRDILDQFLPGKDFDGWEKAG